MSIRRGGSYFRGSGLVVDTSAESSVTGLFGAGDCSMVSGGISAAAAMGAIAGRGAVERVRATEAEPELDEASLTRALARMERPLIAPTGGLWSDLEGSVRDVVTDYVGMRRTDAGMRHAQQVLARLRDDEDQLSASSFHELMRTLESTSIRLAAELMTEAALHRTESRSGAAHRRLDHPETDDLGWKKAIVLSTDGGGALRTEYLSEADRPTPTTTGSPTR